MLDPTELLVLLLLALSPVANDSVSSLIMTRMASTQAPLGMLEIILFLALLWKVSAHLLLSLFLPGWILQWTSATGSVNNYMMEGLMGNFGMTPTTFQITSTDQIQSALWVGTVGQIEVTKVTQFKNSDVFLSTTVTVKNIGSSTVSDLYCKLSLISLDLIFPRHEDCGP